MQQQEEEGKRTSCVFNALRAMSRESKRDGFFSGAHVYFRSGVSLFVFVCSRAQFSVVVDKQKRYFYILDFFSPSRFSSSYLPSTTRTVRLPLRRHAPLSSQHGRRTALKN